MADRQITKSVVFGRDPSCDVIIKDPFMDGRNTHAIQYEDGRVYIEDLGSTNGTTIYRGTTFIKVESLTEVFPGDIICMGRTRLPWKD